MVQSRRMVARTGKDGGVAYTDLRWSRFKTFEPRKMFEIVGEHVFPFLGMLVGEELNFAEHMKDTRTGIARSAKSCRCNQLPIGR